VSGSKFLKMINIITTIINNIQLNFRLEEGNLSKNYLHVIEFEQIIACERPKCRHFLKLEENNLLYSLVNKI